MLFRSNCCCFIIYSVFLRTINDAIWKLLIWHDVYFCISMCLCVFVWICVCAFVCLCMCGCCGFPWNTVRPKLPLCHLLCFTLFAYPPQPFFSARYTFAPQTCCNVIDGTLNWKVEPHLVSLHVLPLRSRESQKENKFFSFIVPHTELHTTQSYCVQYARKM